MPLIMKVQASMKENSFLIGCSRLSKESSVKKVVLNKFFDEMPNIFRLD